MIAAYLAPNADPTMRQGIIQSAHACPLKVKKNGIETIHWSLAVCSPHPHHIHSHHKWENTAENTACTHSTLSSGETSPPLPPSTPYNTHYSPPHHIPLTT